MEDIYQDVISKLRSGQRVHLELEPETLQQIKEQLLSDASPKMSFCLLSHTRKQYPEIHTDLLKAYDNLSSDPETLIAFLGTIQSQVIPYSLKEGEQLPSKLFEILENELSHKDPEVIEWCLRTIDECGYQAKKLYPKIKEIEPGFSRFFNQHKMYMKGIINILEAKWGIK